MHFCCGRAYTCMHYDMGLHHRIRQGEPYFISHGQKIASIRVLLATLSEVGDCVCATCKSEGRNVDPISSLEVAQTYSVSLRVLFGKRTRIDKIFAP